MSEFDADAARAAGMPEHHIEYSMRLAEAQQKVADDPSMENRAALDDLMVQVQAARQYERQTAAGVAPELRLSKQVGTDEAGNPVYGWHSTVSEADADPEVGTSVPELLLEAAPPGSAVARPATVEGTTGAGD